MKKLFLVAILFSSHVFATPVNINSAAAKTISTSLTGISLKQAEAIVASRIQNGNFKSPDDLKRVAELDKKTIATNKADIKISEPNATGRHHPRTRLRHGHTRERRQHQN